MSRARTPVGERLDATTLGRPVAEVAAELDAGRRPEFPVSVAIERADGAVSGEMTVVWTLPPSG